MKERSKLLGSAILIVAMFLMMAGCGSHNSNVILSDKTESAAESADDMVQESEGREESDTIRKSSSDIQNRIRECIAQKKYPQAIFCWNKPSVMKPCRKHWWIFGIWFRESI